jgi:hypothetical protein
MGPGVGLNEGQEEIIHVSIALRTQDGKGVLVSSGGKPDRPYKYNSNREIGYEIIKTLEAAGRLKSLGIKGVAQKLAISGLPFPFSAKNLIPWQGDQTKDVGLHVSLYNQPPSGQYGAKYTPPTKEDVAALAETLGMCTITTKGLVMLNGSELNDDKAGGTYYVGLAATDATTQLARSARQMLKLKVDLTQKFHITSAVVMPAWLNHRKAGQLSINGKAMAAGAYCGEVDGQVLGEEKLKPLDNVATTEGRYPAPQTSHWVLFRRGAGAKGPSQFDKGAVAVGEDLKNWAGWDNNDITSWTSYCDNANAISAANNKVKGELMRTGEIGKIEGAIKAVDAEIKSYEAMPAFGTMDWLDEMVAERKAVVAGKQAEIAAIKADVEFRKPEIFEQMAARTRDILDVLGFPLAVGPNEEGRTAIVAPDELLQCQLMMQLMGDNCPHHVFPEYERLMAERGLAVAMDEVDADAMDVDPAVQA